MSIAFFIAKAIVLSQGRSIECGCFGAIIDTLAAVTIFMDLPMMAMAAVIFVAPDFSRHWAAIGKLLSPVDGGEASMGLVRGISTECRLKGGEEKDGFSVSNKMNRKEVETAKRRIRTIASILSYGFREYCDVFRTS